MLRILAAASLVLVTTACSPTVSENSPTASLASMRAVTSYKELRSLSPAGGFGPVYFGGYVDQSVDATSAQILGAGSNVTSIERARDIAILRALELGQERGFTHFMVEASSERVVCLGSGSAFQGLPRASVTMSWSSAGDGPSIASEIARIRPDVVNQVATRAERTAAFVSNQNACVR